MSSKKVTLYQTSATGFLKVRLANCHAAIATSHAAVLVSLHSQTKKDIEKIRVCPGGRSVHACVSRCACAMCRVQYLFQAKGTAYEDIDCAADAEARDRMFAISNIKLLPQVHTRASVCELICCLRLYCNIRFTLMACILAMLMTSRP